MNHKSMLSLCLSAALALAVPAVFGQEPQADPAQKLMDLSGQGVLNIVALDKDKKEIAKGSAIILSKDTALCNYHIVSQAANVVGYNLKKKKVDVLAVLGVNKAFDLALVKIDGKAQPLPLSPDPAPAADKPLQALGYNDAGEMRVIAGTVRAQVDLGGGEIVLDSTLAVPDAFAGAAVFTEDGKLAGMLMVMERSLKFVVPASILGALKPSGPGQPFKTWAPDPYFGSFESSWLQGRVLAIRGDNFNAQRHLEKVTQAQPANLQAWSLMANVLHKQRDYAAAVRAYQKVVELDPRNVGAFLGMGEIQVLMQKPQDGAANLEKALALNPELKEVHQFLGNAYEASREWAKACAAYEKFISYQPANVWMIYQRLGTCRFEAGEFDAAAAAFGEALKAQPDDQMLNYRLAQSLERASKFEQAEAVYMKLAGLSPKDAMNYHRAVFQMYDKANVTAKAVEAGKKIIELNPKDEQSYYNLGIVYQKAQRLTEAIDSFKKAAEIKPSWDMAHFQIGYGYYALKRYTEAIPHFKKNVEVAPDSFYGYLYIGMCYMQGKQFALAMDPMKKAVDLKPSDGTALFNMGIIYLNLRDKYSALEVAKKLQGIDANLGNRLRSYIK